MTLGSLLIQAGRAFEIRLTVMALAVVRIECAIAIALRKQLLVPSLFVMWPPIPARLAQMMLVKITANTATTRTKLPDNPGVTSLNQQAGAL